MGRRGGEQAQRCPERETAKSRHLPRTQECLGTRLCTLRGGAGRASRLLLPASNACMPLPLEPAAAACHQCIPATALSLPSPGALLPPASSQPLPSSCQRRAALPAHAPVSMT